MTLKEQINNYVTESARYGRARVPSLNLQQIILLMREYGITVTPHKSKKVMKLLKKKKGLLTLRQLSKQLGLQRETHQIKNQVLRDSKGAVKVEFGTIVTMLA